MQRLATGIGTIVLPRLPALSRPPRCQQQTSSARSIVPSPLPLTAACWVRCWTRPPTAAEFEAANTRARSDRQHMRHTKASLERAGTRSMKPPKAEIRFRQYEEGQAQSLYGLSVTKACCGPSDGGTFQAAIAVSGPSRCHASVREQR